MTISAAGGRCRHRSPWICRTALGARDSSRHFRKGFVYADARVDDARLVVCNAIGARELGATVRTRTQVTAAQREGRLWRVELTAANGTTTVAMARALVNAAGPWVKDILDLVDARSVQRAGPSRQG